MSNCTVLLLGYTHNHVWKISLKKQRRTGFIIFSSVIQQMKTVKLKVSGTIKCFYWPLKLYIASFYLSVYCNSGLLSMSGSSVLLISNLLSFQNCFPPTAHQVLPPDHLPAHLFLIPLISLLVYIHLPTPPQSSASLTFVSSIPDSLSTCLLF